jgi:isopenicillin N synthase-like dioxygenase
LAAVHKYQNLDFRLCDYTPATAAPFSANSCGVYTNYGTFSIIFQDGQPGLEAEAPDHPDLWIPIPGNATIVLCGWCALILSDGCVRAVRHRVRRVPGVRRLSTVLFVAPDMEVDLKLLEVDKGSRAFSEAIMEGKINVG